MNTRNPTHSLKFLLAAITAAAAITGSTLASADPYGHHWHGDIRHFRAYDYDRWRGGHWYHGDRGGRFGWWWIAAGTWYFYPAPVYPYPNPYEPPVVVEQSAPEPAPAVAAPPRQSIWYYCDSSRNYYPYVSVCPEGWRTVPAQPSDADR